MIKTEGIALSDLVNYLRDRGCDVILHQITRVQWNESSNVIQIDYDTERRHPDEVPDMIRAYQEAPHQDLNTVRTFVPAPGQVSLKEYHEQPKLYRLRNGDVMDNWLPIFSPAVVKFIEKKTLFMNVILERITHHPHDGGVDVDFKYPAPSGSRNNTYKMTVAGFEIMCDQAKKDDELSMAEQAGPIDPPPPGQKVWGNIPGYTAKCDPVSTSPAEIAIEGIHPQKGIEKPKITVKDEGTWRDRPSLL